MLKSHLHSKLTKMFIVAAHILAFLLVSTSLINPAHSQSATSAFNQISNPVWGKNIASPDEEFEYVIGASSPIDNSIWIVIGIRAKGELGGPQQFKLWNLGDTGDKLKEVNLSALIRERANIGQIAKISSILVSHDNSVFLAINSVVGETYIVRLTNKGEFIGSTALSRGGTALVSQLSRYGTRIQWIGRKSGRGVGSTINKQGNNLISLQSSKEAVSLLTHTSLNSGGEALNVEKIRQVIAGQTNSGTWIALYKANLLEHERLIKGKLTDLIRLESGKIYALLTTVETGNQTTGYVRSFGKNLQLDLGQSDAVKGEVFVGDSTKFLHVNGEQTFLVIANGKQFQIRSVPMKGKSKSLMRTIKLSETPEDILMERIWNFGVIRSKNYSYIIYSAIRVYKKSMQQRQEIGIVKFNTLNNKTLK